MRMRCRTVAVPGKPAEGAAVDVPDSQVSIARRIRQLATESRPDDIVYRHIGLDGTEPGFGWPSLVLLSKARSIAFSSSGSHCGA